MLGTFHFFCIPGGKRNCLLVGSKLTNTHPQTISAIPIIRRNIEVAIRVSRLLIIIF